MAESQVFWAKESQKGFYYQQPSAVARIDHPVGCATVCKTTEFKILVAEIRIKSHIPFTLCRFPRVAGASTFIVMVHTPIHNGNHHHHHHHHHAR
jgi:hypothetical protein